MGTLANILRYLTAPDGTHHLICQGEQRFQIVEYLAGWPFLVARVLRIPEPETRTSEIEARFVNLKAQAVEAIELLPQAPARSARRDPVDRDAVGARRSGGRLYGRQAGGEAGDPGDRRHHGADGQGLAHARRTASRCCGCRRRSAGRPRPRSTSASARCCCASRWRRSRAARRRRRGQGGRNRRARQGHRQGRHAEGGRGPGAQGIAPAADACRKPPANTAWSAPISTG